MGVEATSAETVAAALSAAGASPGQRSSKRKSAKAAAVFIGAAVREEMAFADEDPPSSSSAHQASNKRSYARAMSSASSASHASSSASSLSSLGGMGCGPANGNNGNNNNGSRDPNKSRGGCPGKKKTALSNYAVEYLKAWMMSPDHIEHPYPTEDEKVRIMKETNIELKQLTNWFVNNRKRYWKPKVEEMRRRMAAQAGTEGDQGSLQDMAARAQAANGGTLAQVALKNSTAAAAASAAASTVSSEGEESSSGASPQPAHPAERNSNGKPSKKRKKYSTLGDQPSPAAVLSTCIRANPARKSRTVANPMAIASSSSTSLAIPQPPAVVCHQGKAPNVVQPSIHTAATYDEVKRVRKMSRDLSARSVMTTTSSSSSSSLALTPAATGTAPAPPCAVTVSENSSDEGEEEVSTTPVNVAASAAGRAVGGARLTMVSNPLLQAPPPAAVVSRPAAAPAVVVGADVHPPAGAATPPSRCPPARVSTSSVTDLDYSITPLDDQVAAGAGDIAATTAANAASGTAAGVLWCGVMPHSCNLSELPGRNRLMQPCALCSACRDWNLGEFCPWDLTGILGDISSEDLPNASDVALQASSTSAGDMDNSAHGSGGFDEEATTVTKNSVLDFARIEGGDMESFAVPQVTHSTSSADFISSMMAEAWE